MTAINFNDIEACLGNNDEVLYSNTTDISSALWDTSGFISMGTRPNGDNTPLTWSPDDTTLKNSVFWNGLFPWIAIYSGVNNTATNTRIEISNFECFVYSKVQKSWVDLTNNTTKSPTSETRMNYIMISSVGSADKRVEADGNVSYKLNSSRQPIKAFLDPVRIFGDDVGGVMITCQAKLILDNPVGTDDISAGTAHFLLSVGADYRPDISTPESAFTPEKSPVALGSKFTLITGTNKTFFAVPLNPPGFVVSPGSVYYNGGGRAYLTTEWFERNMPKTFFDRPSIFNDAEFYTPLKTSVIPSRATGVATFTRTTVATVFTDEGKLVTVPSGIVRFAGARFVRNALSRSEGFEQAGWSKTNLNTITTGFTDPFGGTKARFVQVATNASNQLNTTSFGAPDNINGDEACFSIYIKSGNWNQFVIQLGTSTVARNLRQYFNLSTGTIGAVEDTTSAKIQAKIENVGSGWFRVQLTGKFSIGDGSVNCIIRAVMADGSLTYTAVAGANFYLAFAQAERTQRRTLKTASEYVSSGEDATPWHGAGADSCQWFATHQDGSVIPDVNLLGYQYCATSRTNLILWNRDLSNAIWTKTNITSVLTQTGIDNLSNQASLITSTAANGTVLQNITTSGIRASSAHVKRISGTGRIDFTRDGGTNWIEITNLISTTKWTKVKIENSNITNPIIGFRIVNSGDAIAIDFVQDEDGIDATNPIYTTTASVIRNADVLTYPNTNLNDIEGTILATVYKDNWLYNNGNVVGSTSAGLFSNSAINGVIGKDGTNIAPPPSKNYIGDGKFSAPALDIINGHFWAAYSSSSSSSGITPSAWTNIKNEIRDNDPLLGAQLRYAWADLENDAGGTYDFSSIDGRLAELAAIPGKVGLLNIMFEHKGAIPSYLKTSFYDYGNYQYSGGQSGNVVVGTNLCFWNVNVRERLRLLAIQLGTYLNSKSNFANITTQESATTPPDLPGINGAPAGNGQNFSYQGHMDGLVLFASYLKQNMPDKVVRCSINLPGSAMQTAYPAAAALIPGVSFSFPNTLENQPQLEVNQGYPSSYPFARQYKDSNGLFVEVQRPDYYYTNLTWNINQVDGYKLDSNGNPTIAPSGGYRPTIRQLRDFLLTNFNVKQIVWSRADFINTVTGNSFVAEVLNFLNLPENQVPGWGLSTTIPDIYQVNTPTGSIKMAVSWIESKMYINVEGSLVGIDTSYDGSFGLATVGIGSGGAGFVKDVYIWKSIISDDEKRQVTSKKGITTLRHK